VLPIVRGEASWLDIDDFESFNRPCILDDVVLDVETVSGRQ
jgi:hypothetical protein